MKFEVDTLSAPRQTLELEASTKEIHDTRNGLTSTIESPWGPTPALLAQPRACRVSLKSGVFGVTCVPSSLCGLSIIGFGFPCEMDIVSGCHHYVTRGPYLRLFCNNERDLQLIGRHSATRMTKKINAGDGTIINPSWSLRPCTIGKIFVLHTHGTKSPE